MRVKVFAPGRVNLIGEHTDYNEGFVLPFVTEMGITMEASLRSDGLIKARALDLGEEVSFPLAELIPAGGGKNWWDYPAGVCWALMEEGCRLKGADIAFGGDIPVGSGLSSSAALEVATAAAMNYLNGLNLDPKKLALLCQKAENSYVGVQSGIMDQFASMLSRPGRALFIDCRSLEYAHIPLNLSGQELAVIDSRIKRSLAASEYNRRRAECAEALALIGGQLGENRASLRDISIEEIEAARPNLPEALYRRSRFVVEENRRVLEAVEAFRAGDLTLAGQLMNASHAGLRDLYQVSCPELDLLAETAWASPGVWGARMTGAGFGGCVIALVEKEHLPELKRRVLEKTGGELAAEPRFYTTRPAGGARVEQGG